jgi:hypothetical protein
MKNTPPLKRGEGNDVIYVHIPPILHTHHFLLRFMLTADRYKLLVRLDEIWNSYVLFL